MRLRLIKKPFDHPDYLFELKHGGFRTIAYIDWFVLDYSGVSQFNALLSRKVERVKHGNFLAF